MEKSTKSKTKQVSFELIAAIFMGFLAIGIFIFQAITVNSTTTQLETVLFNLLQFLLTIGFAWFSGREVSKSEFEKSLKQFAIGAYRRITDIDKMLRRLQREVGDMLALQPNNQDNLQVIQAIVFDTCQVVQSSTDDWADVIGEELLAIEKIKRLERKKDEIELLENTTGDRKSKDQNLNEIERKINELRSTLPTLLNISSQEKVEEERVYQPQVVSWLLEKHENEDGLVLRVNGEQGNEEKLKQELFLLPVDTGGIDVVDSTQNILGRVLNDSPLSYIQLQRGLELCFQLYMLPVEFLEVSDRYELRDMRGKYNVYKIKVKAEPALKMNIPSRRKK